MHFTKKNTTEKRIELKNKLKKEKILRFPGAYNPLTAKLISEIGFDGIYISGAVMASRSPPTVSSLGSLLKERNTARITANNTNPITSFLRDVVLNNHYCLL